MGKGNIFIGTGSGRIGDIVFYRTRGEQRTRVYIKDVRDPRTYDQMVNRVKMASFSAAYRGLGRLVRTSFLGKKKKQSDFNAFVHNNWVNWTAVEKQVLDTMSVKGWFYPAPYVLSSGGLDSNKFVVQASATEENLYLSGDTLQANILTDTKDNRAISFVFNEDALYDYVINVYNPSDQTGLIPSGVGEFFENYLNMITNSQNNHLSVFFCQNVSPEANFGGIKFFDTSTYDELYTGCPLDKKIFFLGYNKTTKKCGVTISEDSVWSGTTAIAINFDDTSKRFTILILKNNTLVGDSKMTSCAVWRTRRGERKETSYAQLILPSYAETLFEQARTDSSMQSAVESYTPIVNARANILG